MYGVTRTGVRFVLANTVDPARADEASAWYDRYGAAITNPGLLANVFRFENPDAAGDEKHPRFAAIYDIVADDPAEAWPATESSTTYPKGLFDEPGAALIAPALRGSWAAVGSALHSATSAPVTGVYIELSNGGDDTARYEWSKAVVGTGLFSSVSRFRLIEGFPEAAQWLEIYETVDPEPLSAYTRATAALAPRMPDEAIHKHLASSYRLISSHEAAAA